MDLHLLALKSFVCLKKNLYKFLNGYPKYMEVVDEKGCNGIKHKE